MNKRNRNVLLLVLAIFVVAYGALVTTYVVETRKFAVAEADKLVEDALLSHRALHGYVEEVQKPEIYRLKKERLLYEEYFSPKVLSSTFIGRGVAEYLNRERERSGLPQIYFKLATTNPSNPINRADAEEAALLVAMNVGTVTKFRQERQIDGKAYLYVALPTDRNKDSCLRCHGDPRLAPREMLAAYGDQAGFHEQVGSIRAMISIRVPLDGWLGVARQRAYLLSAITLVAMAVIFAAIAYFIRRMDRAQEGLLVSQADLRQANGELSATVRQLQDTQAQLIQAEKMASIGHLAAGVAHEINNPAAFVNSNLTTLAGYFDDLDKLLAQHRAVVALVAAGQPVPAEQLAALAVQCRLVDVDFLREDGRILVKESTDGIARIRKIVADLKDFSNIDRSDGFVEADLNEIVAKAITVAGHDLGAHNAEVTKDFACLPPIRCHPGQIGQVFHNLLLNAAQAVTVRGAIAVHTATREGKVVATVADSGCGIPADIVGRIFDPFFTTRDVGQGAGLGLNIAYNIVRAHGGNIAVTSVHGVGTTFTVELPASAQTLGG